MADYIDDDICNCEDCRRTISGLPSNVLPLAREIHADNIAAGWWQQDPETGRTLHRNVGELLALVHSEISEADEGYEGRLYDDKLPHRQMAEVELADTTIRVLDMLGFYSTTVLMDIRLTAWECIGGFGDRIRVMHRLTTEALEGFRKGDPSRGCRSLVSLLSFIHSTALRERFDLAGAIAEKRAFNRTRADHKLENRQAVGGKAF